MIPRTGEAGFTLIELMITTLLLALVTGVVTQGMLSLNRVNDLVANRTEMHAGVRNATELLQQEVGQAGRVALPGGLGEVTASGGAATSSLTLSSTSGIFVNEYLIVGVGDLQEIVQVATVSSSTVTTIDPLRNTHAGSPVFASGAFAEGIVPTTRTNGSTGSILKLVGDINDDGQMVYIEYVCDTDTGRLYRNAMAWNATSKPAPGVEEVLLDNLLPNPDGTDCFTYQEKTVKGTTFVVGVAVTTTVRTQDKDPVTGDYQKATKALLNVSPRNVFSAWQNASLGYTNRVQPLPPEVVNLLPDPQ